MSLSTGCVLDVDASAIESGISRDRNHHTLTQTDTTTVRGKAGKGTLFNGTTSFVDCGNDSSLDITDAITIEAWVKESSLVGSYITDKADSYRLKLENGNQMRGLLWIDGSLKSSYGTVGEIATDNWYHTFLSYDKNDGANKIKLFLNGKEVSYTFQDNTGGGAIDSVIQNNYLGSYQSSSFYFNGIISSVKIYNYALSATQIKRHYLEKAYLHVPHPVRIP